ncbi:MAG: C40 family peptidase [Gemmatimonadaceae bacterium]
MRPILSSRSLLVPALAALVPITALAQTRHALGFHVGRNDALPTETTLGGLSYTSWAGSFGVRASGAIALGRVDRTDNNVDGTTKITAWTGDADVLLSPFRHHGMMAGLRPFGFLGIGGHGARYTDGDRAEMATWSYGWGVAWNLSRAFGLEASARRRIQLQDDVKIPPGFNNDWEYRAGISIEFGGRRRSVRPRTHPRRAEPVYDERRKRDHDRGRDEAARDDRDDRPPVLARPDRMPVSASGVVRSAHRYEGVRYSYGGATPTKGFDCSGFVQYVFGRHGIDLPRTARQMSERGELLPLDLRDLREGDLLFFADNGTRIDHVAIYLGDGLIIHSTASGGGVRAESLSTPRGEWFERRWVSARRIVGNGRPRMRSLEDDDRRPESLDPPDNAPPPSL